MKPMNWSLDRKGSLIMAFIVILFLFPTILSKEGLERSHGFLGRQLSTFHKKAVFFSGKYFAHINVGYCLLKCNVSRATVEVLFLVS